MGPFEGIHSVTQITVLNNKTHNCHFYSISIPYIYFTFKPLELLIPIVSKYQIPKGINTHTHCHTHLFNSLGFGLLLLFQTILHSTPLRCRCGFHRQEVKGHPLVSLRGVATAVAQEVKWLSANRKVAGTIPGLHLAKCRGVPEQDT